MKVSFELSPRDLRYFRERLKSARAGDGVPDEDSVIQQATQLVEDAVKVDPPEFVRVRLLKLQQLAEMLRDEEWRLEGRDRARILDALVGADDAVSQRTYCEEAPRSWPQPQPVESRRLLGQAPSRSSRPRAWRRRAAGVRRSSP